MEFMKKYLLIIAALFSLTSCLDNKLDESFKDINEVKRWENIEESYSVYAGEEIVWCQRNLHILLCLII